MKRRARVAGLLLAICAGTAVPGAAAVDATGRWRVVFGQSMSSAPLTVKQVGDLMIVAGAFAPFQFEMRIDPATGAFATAWAVPSGCLGAPSVRGSVSPDGMSITGTGLSHARTAIPPRGGCGEPQPFTFSAVRSLCGNGMVDAGEACDPCPGCQQAGPCDDAVLSCHQSCDVFPLVCYDGDACTTDACYGAAGCRYEPRVCADDNDCTSESCDPTSGCVQTPRVDRATLALKFDAVRSALRSAECAEGVLSPSIARKLRRRVAKSRKVVMRAALAPTSASFGARIDRAHRVLTGSADLVPPDRFESVESHECISGLTWGLDS